MKRTIAMLLAVLLMTSVFALSFAVFADDERTPTDKICVRCGQPHTTYYDENGVLIGYNDEDGTIGLHSCTCCLECYYLDNTALTKCARNAEGHYIGSREKMCCSDCTGFFPCLCTETNEDCSCVYCGRKSQQNEQEPVDVVPDKAKNIFTSVFSTVFNKLSEVFTKLFDLLFAVFGVDD